MSGGQATAAMPTLKPQSGTGLDGAFAPAAAPKPTLPTGPTPPLAQTSAATLQAPGNVMPTEGKTLGSAGAQPSPKKSVSQTGGAPTFKKPPSAVAIVPRPPSPMGPTPPLSQPSTAPGAVTPTIGDTLSTIGVGPSAREPVPQSAGAAPVEEPTAAPGAEQEQRAAQATIDVGLTPAATPSTVHPPQAGEAETRRPTSPTTPRDILQAPAMETVRQAETQGEDASRAQAGEVPQAVEGALAEPRQPDAAESARQAETEGEAQADTAGHDVDQVVESGTDEVHQAEEGAEREVATEQAAEATAAEPDAVGEERQQPGWMAQARQALSSALSYVRRGVGAITGFVGSLGSQIHSGETWCARGDAPDPTGGRSRQRKHQCYRLAHPQHDSWYHLACGADSQ